MKKTSNPYIILFFIVLSQLAFIEVYAQPELKNLYTQSSEAMAQKDYERAINIYFQAIRLNPSDIVLRRDLAYAYLLNNQADKGTEVVKEIIESGRADEESYQLAAALEKAQNNNRKSLSYINDGLKAFPNSGLLHHAKGLHYFNANPKKPNVAMPYFQDGIKAQPNYANNYLSLARLLFNEKEYLWAGIYAEIYLLLDINGSRMQEARKLLYDSYKSIYGNQSLQSIPKLQSLNNNQQQSFTSASQSIMNKHFSVFADEYNVEHLIMFRSRFIIDWMQQYELGTHTLYDYWNRMLAEGHFDAYNQYIFGSLDDSQAYAAWAQNNNQALNNFQNWMQNNQYLPNTQDPHYSK